MDNSTAAPEQTPVTQQATTFTAPQTWPGAFGAYKYSRDVVRANIGTFAGLLLFSIVSSILIASLGGTTEPNKSIFSLLSDLVGIWINAAIVVTFLAGVHSTKVGFTDTLKKGGSIFLKFFALSFLTGVIAIVSIVALIVPFFFIFPRIMLATYYLVDKDLGPIEALKASWNETKGHTGKVWGIIGASLAMAVLVIVLVGIYFLIMYSAVLAVLYVYIQNTKSAPVAAPVVEAVPAAPPTPIA